MSSSPDHVQRLSVRPRQLSRELRRSLRESRISLAPLPAKSLSPAALIEARATLRAAQRQSRGQRPTLDDQRLNQLIGAAHQLESLTIRPAARRERRWKRWSAGLLSAALISMQLGGPATQTWTNLSLTCLCGAGVSLIMTLIWSVARREARRDLTRPLHPSWRSARSVLRPAGSWIAGALGLSLIRMVTEDLGTTGVTPLDIALIASRSLPDIDFGELTLPITLITAALAWQGARGLGEELIGCQRRSDMRRLLAQLWTAQHPPMDEHGAGEEFTPEQAVLHSNP